MLSAPLKAHLQTLEGQVSWAARHLGTGQTLIHQSRRFLAASTIKLPILAYYALSRDLMRPVYHYDARDWVEDSPLFEGLKPGDTVDWDTLAVWMMIRSDNAATNLVIRELGLSHLQAWMASFSWPDTQLNRLMMDLEARSRGIDNWTSPVDMLEFMQALVKGQLLSADATAWTLDILARCEDREKIPHLFPPSFLVYNKPGELPGTRSDVGYISDGQHEVVMALFSDHLPTSWDGPLIDDALAELARLLWCELGGPDPRC